MTVTEDQLMAVRISTVLVVIRLLREQGSLEARELATKLERMLQEG